MRAQLAPPPDPIEFGTHSAYIQVTVTKERLVKQTPRRGSIKAMKRNTTYENYQTITLAKLCEALENGTLAAQKEDDMFVIRNSDLRRLAHSFPMKLSVAEPRALAYFQKAS